MITKQVIKEWWQPSVLLAVLSVTLAWSYDMSNRLAIAETKIEQDQKQQERMEQKIDKIIDHLIGQNEDEG